MPKISVWSSGDASIALIVERAVESDTVLDPTLEVRQMVLGKAGHAATLQLRDAIIIPERFLTADGSDWRLENLDLKLKALIDEAQRATDAVVREQRNRLVEQFRKQRAEIRNRFLLARVVVRAEGAGDFFGLRTFAGASIQAQVCLDLPELLAEGATPNTIVLQAQATAEATIQIGQEKRTASWSLVITCSMAAELRITPVFELPAFPGIPFLNLNLPPIELPDLKIPDLKFGSLEQIFRFNVPVPDLDVRIQWDAGKAPPVEAVVSGSDLVVRTAGAPGTTYSGSLVGQETLARIEGFCFSVDHGVLSMKGRIEAKKTSPQPARSFSFGGSDAIPLTVNIQGAQATLTPKGKVDLNTGVSDFLLETTLDMARIEVRAKNDPSLVLALRATYVTTADQTGRSTGSLTRLDVIEPYPVKLVTAAAQAVVEGLIRLIGLVDLPDMTQPGVPDITPLLERIGKLITAALEYLAEKAGEAARALIGVAEAAARLLGQLLQLLKKAASAAIRHVSIEVRLDAATLALRQIIISPAKSSEPDHSSFELDALGLNLSVPGSFAPALVMDFGSIPIVALTIAPTGNAKASLSTDLWLRRDGAGSEAIRDTDATGARPHQRLISVNVEPTAAAPPVVAIVAFEGGTFSFLRLLAETTSDDDIDLTDGTKLKVRTVSSRTTLKDLEAEVGVTIDVNPDGVERLLPFLSSPKADHAGTSLADKLGQYIKIKGAATKATIDKDVKGVWEIPLDVEIKLDSLSTETKLTLNFDPRDFSASIKGGDVLTVKGKEPEKPYDLFGLKAVIKPREPLAQGVTTFAQFVLDFKGGDVRLALAEEAIVDLTYRKIASRGRGLVFTVDEFAVARNVFDIEARVDPNEPVTMAGIDMPFRFSEGALSVKRGEVQAFSIKGTGQLPPALVGEANATIRVAFSRGGNGQLEVQSAEAELDKSGDPLVCHGTRFAITITKLGFDYRDFGSDGGYHFFFTLTGSAVFTPQPGEMSDGLLKYLPNLKIVLDKAPLASDPRLLMSAIEFQVAVEPKKKINFFELFTFELRGIGFHPASPAFGGKPAMSISGQVHFVEAGDIVSPSFEFHKLWIAPPKAGQSLPQIRFDGLGVGLSLGGTATVEGTAIAVDDKLPSIYAPDTLPANVTARGFLASGRLSVKGWASMSAAMGFLELQEENQRPRHAFFLYGQANELSVRIPTPIGNLYLREVGFGLGYRFTLAGLARADRVTNPDTLVEVLDEVSRYQGDLDNIRAWNPEATGNRLTLAMRAMFSIATASEDGSALKEAEKKLSNPVLFDVTAALRSDLTFLMTVRAWIAVNYWTWARDNGRKQFADKPMLRGYLYISVPRQEFLARTVSDPAGYIGSTPELPEPLKTALQNSYWSSTLYIRPGLFHQEFGWPYELGFDFKQGDDVLIRCRGGMITRIEDFSLLYGIAFKADGFAKFGGQVGGRSFGASVTARADFSIEAKFIAYLSLKRFNDTLFYGSVGFSVALSFGVRVWLEFSVGFTDIHLEVSFTGRLTVTVSLEIAVAPNALGGRGAATVSVSAFGRSLGIGVAFGFNQDMLRQARERVERFLALGLEASVPDPSQGLAPPRPAQSAATASDAIAAGAANAEVSLDLETSTPPAQPQSRPDINGDCIGTPHFWAMLFEVAAVPGTYVMTFIPRDRTRLEMAGFELEADNSTFYAPPGVAGQPDYELLATQPMRRLKADNAIADEEQIPIGTNPIKIDQDRVLYPNGDHPLLFQHFLRECFVTRTSDGQLRQPGAEPIAALRKTLSSDPLEAARTLREAGLDQVNRSPSRQAWRDVEERRSAVIATVCDSAARIAAGAVRNGDQIEWPRRPATGLDARDFGLTFYVDDPAKLEKLFAMKPGGKDETPPESEFKLRSRNRAETNPGLGDSTVYLFNPPAREFRAAKPRLAAPRVWLDGSTIKLDWDLEPAWGQSKGPWHDPEFHLKHYRIQRVVIDELGVVSEANPEGATTFTSKAGAPLKSVIDDGKVVWHPIRPAAQFADDLARLPQDYRDAILHTGDAPWAAWERIGKRLQVIYTIVPVDISGTEGDPTPLVFQAVRPVAPAIPVVKAEFLVHYGLAIPRVGQRVPVDLSLRIDDALFRDASDRRQPQRRPRGGARYRLKIRAERGFPAGLYGADALTQAQQRPSSADFDRYDIGDVVFEFEVKEDVNALVDEFPPLRIEPRPPEMYCFQFAKTPTVFDGDVDRPGLVSAPTMADLWSALGIDTTNELRPVRLAIRRMRSDLVWSPPIKGDDDLQSLANSPWCVVDTILRVGTDQGHDRKRRPYPIDATVEVFEHPRDIAFEPLHFDDLDGEAGRLLVYVPSATADLRQLCAPAGPNVCSSVGSQGELRGIRRLRDPARRIGTRIRWNSRPVALEERPAGGLAPSQPARDAELIGGFDLFEVDMSAVTTDAAPLATFARRAARVQVLPKSLAKLDPAQIDDYGAIEATYPSDTLRLTANEGERDGNPRRRRAAWFSSAESLPVFPRRVLRRSLAMDHEESALTALFARGRPHALELSVNWPDGVALPTLWRQLDDGSQEPQPDGGFVRSTGRDSWTPAAISTLLRSLTWGFRKQHEAEDSAGYEGERKAFTEAVDARYRKKPEAFAETRLMVRAIYRQQPSGTRITIGEVDLPITWEPDLHPMLADVLEELRWSDNDSAPYRRYSPVLDGAPQTKAESITALMDERPPERDPYGWALLRTFGLATGLRLFDTERGDYLSPRTSGTSDCGLLDLVERAIRRIHSRYVDVAGAPFVELIARAEGLMTTASFDEANPGLALREIDDLLENETLAMVQISLRPMPDGMAKEARRAVQYFVGRRGKVPPDGGRIVFNPGDLNPDAGHHLLVEVIDISHGLAGGRVVPLAAASDTVAVKLWNPDGDAQTAPYVIDVAGAGPDDPVALLRVTHIYDDAECPNVDLSEKLKALVNWQLEFDPVIAPRNFGAKAVDGADSGSGRVPEPFERFGELPAPRFATVIFGSKPAAWNKDLDSPASIREAYESFADLARRRFAKDWPKTDALEARTAFVARLVPWLSRFLAYGAARLPRFDQVPFALATLTRSDPWRVEPQIDGSMEILLLHNDRFARRRRYIVRPFGRYDSFVSAARAADAGDQKDLRPATLAPVPNDVAFDLHSVDITVPRTAPVTAPVIVSAQRLDIQDGAMRSVDSGAIEVVPERSIGIGRVLEIVLSRHEEELLSEANARVADGLQFEHVAVGFWREFAARKWADAVWKEIEGAPPLDLLPEIGNYRVDAPARLSFPDSHSFDRDVEACRSSPSGGALEVWRPNPLPRRIVDGWRGVTALRTRSLPHFYRLHAVAYASGGVVVSPPSAAVIPEGHYENRVPWDDALLGTHRLDPQWEVVRGPSTVEVKWTIPLSRFIDGMPNADRILWQPATGTFPDAFLLPDPGVSYVMALASVIGDSEIVGLSTEMEFMALPPADIAARANYAVTSPGTRLQPVGPASPLSTVSPRRGPDAAWYLDVPTRIRAGGDTRKLDAGWAGHLMTFEVPADSEKDAPTSWAPWRDAAPTGTATITMRRPSPGTPEAWQRFMDAIVQWRKAFDAYGDDARMAADVLAPFSEGMNDDRWTALAGDGAALSVRRPVAGPWRAGLPVLHAWTLVDGADSRDQAVEIAVTDWSIREPLLSADSIERVGAFRRRLTSAPLRIPAGVDPAAIAEDYEREVRSLAGLVLDADWAKDLTRFEVPADTAQAEGTPSWTRWRPSAPTGTAAMTITRPGTGTAAAWRTFMDDIVEWREALEPYGDDARSAFDLLEPFSAGMNDARWRALAGGGNPSSLVKPISGEWRAGLPILNAWTAPTDSVGARGTAVRIEAKDWRVGDWARCGISARDQVRATLHSEHLRIEAGFEPGRAVAPRLARDLRRIDGQIRIGSDEALFADAVAPYAISIPEQLIDPANTLSQDIAPPFDLICERRIKVAGNETSSPLWDGPLLRPELSALFQALEDYRITLDGAAATGGVAAAIVALGALEETGGVEVALLIPHHALKGAHPVHLALEALGTLTGVSVGPKLLANTLVLRRPPNGIELAALAKLDEKFGSFVARAAMDQLFGPNRRPLVKILHGLTDPVVQFLRRAA